MLTTARLVLSEIDLERDGAAFQAFMLRESYWGETPMERPTAEWVDDWLQRQALAHQEQPRWVYFLAAREREIGQFNR